MAKKARKKSASKARAGRSKAGAKTKVKSKSKTKVKAKRRTKMTRKAAARRNPRRTARPKKQSGIMATVANAFHNVTESIKDTATLRNKMERPGESETG